MYLYLVFDEWTWMGWDVGVVEHLIWSDLLRRIIKERCGNIFWVFREFRWDFASFILKTVYFHISLIFLLICYLLFMVLSNDVFLLNSKPDCSFSHLNDPAKLNDVKMRARPFWAFLFYLRYNSSYKSIKNNIKPNFLIHMGFHSMGYRLRIIHVLFLLRKCGQPFRVFLYRTYCRPKSGMLCFEFLARKWFFVVRKHEFSEFLFAKSIAEI